MSLSEALLLDPYPFEIWISTRSDSAGTGTLNDPFGASTAAKFDKLMRDISAQPGPVLVHLGPGVFKTTGYSDQETNPSWQMKAGMRIVGAGKGVTTLQLVSTVNDRQYFAIGHKLTTGASPDVPNPVDFAEVSDLCIDCDTAGQSGATVVACGAIRLMGNHVKVERVKAKRWGNKGSSPKPCFVFAVLTGDRTVNNTDVSNVGIQDCVAVEPATPTGSVTVFHAGGTEATARNDEAFGKGPYIRRCFVDCGTLGTSALTADIRALSMGWCRAGVIEQNQIHNLKIGGPYQDKATTRVVQQPLRYLFDEVMAALEPNTTVHLSPGVFETRGQGQNVNANLGFYAKSGWRIIGAGMGLTTLKLVGGAVRERQYAAFYANTYLDGLEISALTVDCNLEDQPNTDVLCAAVNAQGGGRHVRVRRVRAINWGTRFPDNYRENFVFFLASRAGVGDAIDCVFEECVAEQPSPNNHWNSTLFAMGGNAELEWRGTKGANYACAIRDCYVDARNDYGPVVLIASISWNSGIVTVVTRGPHGHRKPGNLIVQGVSNNGFNGIFEIDSVSILNDTTLYYKLTANPGMGSGGTIGGRVSSNDITLNGVAAVANNRFKLTTRGPHFRTKNNTIKVVGITDNGSVIPALNGTFPIVDYDPTKPNELTYQTNQAYTPVGTLSTIRAVVKTGHSATGADNGIVEGNRIFHCFGGGPFHDTWSVRDMVARENYYQDVLSAPNVFLSGGSVSPWPWGNGAFGRLRLKSLEFDDSELICPLLAIHAGAEYEKSIATVEPMVPSVQRHCLLQGDFVLVTTDGVNGSIAQHQFEVFDTPDAFSFTFESGALVAPPGSTPAFLPVIKNSYDNNLYTLRPLDSVAVAGPVNGKYTITATVRDLPQTYNGITTHYDQHGLEVGEIVKIGNVGTYPNRSSVLNGNFKITEIVDEKTFCVEVDSAVDPGDPADAGYYGRIWRCDYWLFENNVVETAIRHLWAEAGDWRDSAITLGLGGNPPQYHARQVVIRDNLFRHVNNASDPNKNVSNYPLPRAMQFGASPFGNAYGIEDALVQRNIVRLDSVAKVILGQRPTPIEFQPNFDSQRGVQTFNNISPDGILIPAVNDPQLAPLEKRPELVSRIEAGIDEAVCVSFLM